MPKRHDDPSVADKGLLKAFEPSRIRGVGVTSQMLAPGQVIRYALGTPRFHFIEGGVCTLQQEPGSTTTTLQPGDLVFLPRGDAHLLQHTCVSGPAVLVMTGEFQLEGPGAAWLRSALPAGLRVGCIGIPPPGAPESPVDWLTVTLAAIRLESERPALGSALMVSRLMDLLLVWAVRHWLATASLQQRQQVAVNGNGVVGRSLALLHAQPAQPWSVDALARLLNTSRSSLSQHFTQAMGEPPMRYLARWRMRMAADLLASTPLRVSQIAQKVGYASEAAFSRAFRRHFGVAPAAHRNDVHAAVPGAAAMQQRVAF